MYIHPEIRLLKHRLFSGLPGKIGKRNTYWYRMLSRSKTDHSFQNALAALAQDAVCIDLGANLGKYTKQLAHKAGKVYAFEPDPWTFSKLEQNTNHLTNVELIQAAAGAEDGEIEIYRETAFAERPEHLSVATSIYPTNPGSTLNPPLPCRSSTSSVLS